MELWQTWGCTLTTVNYCPFCVPAADKGPSGGQVGVISSCQVTKALCVLHTVFSQAGESPPSAPQLSGLKNEVGREIHKPVLKNLFAGKLLIDPLGRPLPDPLHPSASCCRDGKRGKMSFLVLSGRCSHRSLWELPLRIKCLLPNPSKAWVP